MNRILFEDGKWKQFVENPQNWRSFHKKRYRVKLQRALQDKVYNMPGKPGVVYNFLEDCEETVGEAACVATGLLGEMWPMGPESLSGYEVRMEDISEEPKYFWTKGNGRIYYALQIPLEMKFQVETPYGVLNGNHKVGRIPHGTGDYLVCNSLEEGDYRIVNGSIFERMYEGNHKIPHTP